MKLTLISGALLVGMLSFAGSSLAVVEAVGMQAAFVQASADAALVFATQTAADAQAKASLFTSAAITITSNAQGQATSAAALAASIAQDAAGEPTATASGAAATLRASGDSAFTLVTYGESEAVTNVLWAQDLAQRAADGTAEALAALQVMETGPLTAAVGETKPCGEHVEGCAEPAFWQTLLESLLAA